MSLSRTFSCQASGGSRNGSIPNAHLFCTLEHMLHAFQMMRVVILRGILLLPCKVFNRAQPQALEWPYDRQPGSQYFERPPIVSPERRVS